MIDLTNYPPLRECARCLERRPALLVQVRIAAGPPRMWLCRNCKAQRVAGLCPCPASGRTGSSQQTATLAP